MIKSLLLVLAVFFAVSFSACAQEVAYAYGESGGRPLESGNITSKYNGSDIVTNSIAGAGPSLGGSGMTVDEMKQEIALKLNVGNPRVRDEGLRLIRKYGGDGTINQFCSLYDHMVANWSYARDTRGREVLQYSNQSLDYGEGENSGQGDCDDFAILLASLIESVGGTSRIILAYGPNSGHAYTEVYLGKAGGPESDVGRMVSWLRKSYGVKEINTHIDIITGDVWLNLDWWKDPNTRRELARHPGGPFFKATSQVPVPFRENITLQPPMPVNEPPEVMFTISPEMPVVGLNTSFDASKSRDIGGRIEAYEFDFGDGNKTVKMSQPITSHIYSKGGPYTVTLTLEDDVGAINSSSRHIIVNNPPQANFTIMPPNPKVGDQVKFDASESFDAEDGRSLQYYWEIDNGSAIFRAVSPPKLPFDEPGMHWVNLTVTDKNGAKGYKNIHLKINQRPIPRINFDNTSLTLGMTTNFSADASEDPDGEIVRYSWNFSDNSEVDHNKTAMHIYDVGGEMPVGLTVEDNDGAISDTSCEIFINRPPVASFSIDPEEPKKGNPVSFNASESYDPDGELLEYSWDFGEGIVEPVVYKKKKLAMHPYYASGKYNVVLTVEDDRGATGSFSKLVDIGEISAKTPTLVPNPDEWTEKGIGIEYRNMILFDESHHQFWTASAKNGLADYANQLRQNGYKVDILTKGPITYSKLKGYDVLAFPNGFYNRNSPDEGALLLSDDEINAIKSFVYEGGGLALFECGWSWAGYSGINIDSAPINQIGEIFGMTLNDDVIHDPTNNYNKSGDSFPIFYRPFIRDHPITMGVEIISNCEGIPSSLAISNPDAEILITGDDDSYSDNYAVGQRPPFLAAANYGKGKVVIFGQTGIISSTDGNNDGIRDIYEYNNKRLGLNIMNWLSSS